MSGLSGGVTVLSGFTYPNPEQTIISVNVQGSQAFNTNGDYYTVTAGKVFYCMKIIGTFTVPTGAGAYTAIRDNTTSLYKCTAATTFSPESFFPTPLIFDTSINMQASGTGSGSSFDLMFIGWEQ